MSALQVSLLLAVAMAVSALLGAARAMPEPEALADADPWAYRGGYYRGSYGGYGGGRHYGRGGGYGGGFYGRGW